MADFVSVLSGASKRACIDEKLINRKIIALKDSQEFLTKVRDDIAGTHRLLPALEIGGILMISFAMVADVIRDTAGRAGEKEFPQLKAINWVYDKARKHRNDKSNNKFKKELGTIKKALDIAKKKLPKGDSGDAIGMTIETFYNLAQNTCLLMTYIEDGQETRKAVVRSLDQSNKLLERLDKQLAGLEHWAAIGEQPAAPPRMTPVGSSIKLH